MYKSGPVYIYVYIYIYIYIGHNGACAYTKWNTFEDLAIICDEL